MRHLNIRVWLLLLATVTGWPQAPGSEPAAEPFVGDIVNIDFRTDVRVFSVMAALNSAGFDYEKPGSSMSPTRLRLRQDLKNVSPQLVSELKAFYDSHLHDLPPQQIQSAYVSLSLLVSGPPEFKLQMQAVNLPGDAHLVQGFEELLDDFYRQAEIGKLWPQYEAAYLAELQQYRGVLRGMIRQTLDYFRVPARVHLDRQLILIPDLLNIQGVVNARNLERTYYVVVGPTEDPASNYKQLQHEYLHFLVDPLVEKFGAILLQNQELLSLAQRQPEIPRDYQNKFLVVVAESLIESLLLRLHPPDDLDRAQLALFRKGLVLVPHFYRRLEEYENSELLAFPAYSEVIFQSISNTEARQAGEQLSAVASEHAESAETEASVPANHSQSLLDQAGQLIQAKDYNAARAVLDQILAMDSADGRAHFYLAQIAAQLQQHELAFDHYQKAAEAPASEPWLRAFALLRSGNFLAFQGEFARARQLFNQVLSLEGDLRGAREQAGESLSRLPPPD